MQALARVLDGVFNGDKDGSDGAAQHRRDQRPPQNPIGGPYDKTGLGERLQRPPGATSINLGRRST
jgi:hypothetical protein